MLRSAYHHNPAYGPSFLTRLAAVLTLVVACSSTSNAADLRFDEQIRPILEDHCFKCHGNGVKKGGVDLDEVRSTDQKLWWNVLKNVRSGIMPPGGKDQPSLEERTQLETWIKSEAFRIDPANPDPGRVTVRRLNRVEYRNTIRDLMGVEYDATAEFPPDDSGHGFDNIGDVLSISSLLLEKYLAAAKTIVSRTVPTVSKVVPEQVISARSFHRTDGGKEGPSPPSLSYYEAATVQAKADIEHDGPYRLIVDLSANEKYVDGVSDANRCRVILSADGEELASQEFVRQAGKSYQFEFDREWKAGPHQLTIELQPLTPDEKQTRSLVIRIRSATVRGPMDERYWVRPVDYERFFPGQIPTDSVARRAYTRDLLGVFASKAFRRPVDDVTRDRLAALAEASTADGKRTYEAGVGHAMSAVLTSPRFLFREESVEPTSTGPYPLVDEYALASRLSYFLWSTMPDAELISLAGEHKLRENLKSQVTRMLADRRSAEFNRHFIGQWLQVRDIDSVTINAQAVMAREQTPDPEADRRRLRFRELVRKPAEELNEAEKKELQEGRAAFGGAFRRSREFELTGELRQAMKRETEMLFEHIITGDRSLLELLDSDYTFLNERLAKHYAIENVTGETMRRVDLPAGSPRGGVLTQGTILAVTSNPDRTSPVKRGLFILDNILGSPPAPPPPNIPSLEEAGKKVDGRLPTLRESMVLHRNEPTCAGCHARMDPLGLALENFNALGRWRDNERTETIDASGKLISGEAFEDIRQVKRILVEHHRPEFYQCLTEKLLTYALGRGLEAYDVQAVDTIVGQIEKNEGRSSALITGIVESAPFQRRRRSSTANSADLTDRSSGRPSDLTR